MPFSSCCPGGREMWVEKGVNFRAFLLCGWALKPGAKGRSAIVFGQAPPPGSEVRLNLLEGVAAALPDHGVSWLVAVLGPQVGGLLRTAFGPPSRLTLKFVNGTWGRPCGTSPASGSTF